MLTSQSLSNTVKESYREQGQFMTNYGMVITPAGEGMVELMIWDFDPNFQPNFSRVEDAVLERAGQPIALLPEGEVQVNRCNEQRRVEYSRLYRVA